jgi:hypothetical protein
MTMRVFFATAPHPLPTRGRGGDLAGQDYGADISGASGGDIFEQKKSGVRECA